MLGTAGGSRTHNLWFLRPAPLPVGLQQQMILDLRFAICNLVLQSKI